MASIQYVCELWTNLDFDSLIETSIMGSEPEIIDAQVNQMRHGLRPDGTLIGTYKYEKYQRYAKAKFAQNSLAGFGNVDLILKGDFTNNIELEYSNDFIIPRSTVETNVYIIKNYDEGIYGLMPDALNEIISDNIKPSLINSLRNAVQV
jgi:hypothetical protein